MKKVVFWSFLILISLQVCKENDVIEAKGSFSALSYNVAGLPNGISSSQPLLYSTLISPHLNDFDIVHLQEDFCYHDSVILYNNHRSRTEDVPCIGDGLNTLTNFHIRVFESVKWNDCTGADCLSAKGFSYSKIVIEEGITIDFYNIHCNAGSSQASIEARRKNMEQFLTYMLAKSEGEAIIVMGDFNHKYTRLGDSTRVMLSLGFNDPWIELVTGGIIPDYSPNNLDNCYPLNTTVECEGVDKVFYRSTAAMKLKVIEYKYGDDPRFFYQGDDTQPLSDHSPLSVVFEYDYVENRTF